jgi:hypothetical protein
MLAGMICCPGELLDRPDDAIDRAYFRGFLLDNEISWGEALLILAGGVSIPTRLPPTYLPLTVPEHG